MKLLLQFVRYIEACVTSPDWLDKFHSFFSASFLLAKESERFIFLGIFCNLLVQSFLNFQSRVGWLFCENNQKWTKTKHCFDTFDSNDTFGSSESNERFDKHSQTQRADDSSPGRIQAAPLSWLNFVTSYSSWEALKIKLSKTNRWIIIVTIIKLGPASYNYFDTWFKNSGRNV